MASLIIAFLLLSASAYILAQTSPSVDDADVVSLLALSDDLAYGEYLAGECASCHAKKAVTGSNVPVIHGVSAKYIARALLEYRVGVRENSTMKNVAQALGDEEIAVLAHYLAQQTD